MPWLLLQRLRDLVELGLVDLAVVDRLEHALLDHRLDGGEVGVEDVPGHVAALDHRLELGRLGRAVVAHLEAGLPLERREHHLAQALGPRAAPAHHDELALVGPGRARVEERADRRGGARRARRLHEGPACRESAIAHVRLLFGCGVGIAGGRRHGDGTRYASATAQRSRTRSPGLARNTVCVLGAFTAMAISGATRTR